jgi:hypothetical protein
MLQSHANLIPKKVQTFLMALSFAALLMPGNVLSAERDGTVLFFSFEDLPKELSQPAPPQWLSNFTWHTPKERHDNMTPLERNYFWGNGLGIDGYARPGTRPLWGY